MLNHMFPAGETQIRLSELRNQFYVAIPTIKSDILAELKSKGMYSVDPDSAHAYVLVGVVAHRAAVCHRCNCWAGPASSIPSDC